MFNLDVLSDKELKARMAITRNIMVQVSLLWRSLAINSFLKALFIQALVWPIVTNDIKKLGRFEIQCYQKSEFHTLSI